MKLKELIHALQAVEDQYGGDVEAQLQTHGVVEAVEVVEVDENSQPPVEGEAMVISFESFFIVPETYENNEVIVNIRHWPY